MADSFVGIPLAIPLASTKVLATVVVARGCVGVRHQLFRNSFPQSEEVAS
jgi:hypothetical protein